MDEILEGIGDNAGKVWQILKDQGPQSVTSLGRQTRLKAAETNQAVGWLAREGKLKFEEKGNKVTISLKS
jgi:hypothetical protein